MWSSLYGWIAGGLLLAFLGIKTFFAGRAQRRVGRTESERDNLKEILARVKRAKAARREARRTPNYLGGTNRVPDEHNRDE